MVQTADKEMGDLFNASNYHLSSVQPLCPTDLCLKLC